jgi:hypothetical protein
MIKTIDIQAKEWFDRINGNSYFSAIITINFGLEEESKPTGFRVLKNGHETYKRRVTQLPETQIKLHFQYGYGEHYIDVAKQALIEHNYISSNDSQPLWRYCKEQGIILRTSKYDNCKKRDVIAYTN